MQKILALLLLAGVAGVASVASATITIETDFTYASITNGSVGDSSTSANSGGGVASVTRSLGTGSAVTTVDRQANFDTLTTSGLLLWDYTEDGLSVTAPNVNYVGFDAFNEGVSGTMFHYGWTGGRNYVTIRGTDSAVFAGLELRIGDGYGTPVTQFAFETYLNGLLTGSGNSILVPKGSVIGFSDPNGFDELRIGGRDELSPSYKLGDYQAIAIDDVRVELVPEVNSVVMAALASGAGVVALRRRR